MVYDLFLCDVSSVSQVSSTGEAVAQGLMGAAVTVSVIMGANL